MINMKPPIYTNDTAIFNTKCYENDWGWNHLDQYRYKTNFVIGIKQQYYPLSSLSINGSFVYDMIINPLYDGTVNADEHLQHNISLLLGIKYTL